MAAINQTVAFGGMADNSTASGLVSMITSAGITSSRYILIAAATAAFVLLVSLVTPRLDAQEPPLLKPSLPFIGHMIGLMKHQAQYHVFLQRKTNHQSAATLSILGGKLYALWDPALVAAGLRSKDLSFTAFSNSIIKPLFLADDDTVAMVHDPKQELLNAFMGSMTPSLAGDDLRHLNGNALELLQDIFSGMETATDVPNLWLWVRGMMMTVTAKALYGDDDPFQKDRKLEDSLWAFQEGIPKLFLGILPAWIAPTGHRARAHLQSKLKRYYAAHSDEGTSPAEFVRGRARVLRSFGLSSSEIGKLEIMLPYAANTNTVPTVFWLITYIFSRPQLVTTLRKEVEPLAATSCQDSTVTLDFADMETRCPRLNACYRESLRLTNHQTSARRVVRDTVMTDSKGKSYLLKAGIDVQLSIATSHLTEEVWGANANEFDPERFLRIGGGRAQRQAYQPFGGGSHLCPGRSFAFMEIMAVLVTLLLGYDLGTPDGTTWIVPESAQWSMVDSIHKPIDDGAGTFTKMAKRKGWENVRWRYKM